MWTTYIVDQLGMDSWFLVDPVGFSTGNLLLYNSHNIEFHMIREDTQGVHGVVEVRATKSSFIFSAIYASPKLYMHKLFWNELLSFSTNMIDLVLGDKLGGPKILSYRSRLYADTMNKCRLMDIGFFGPKFTWNNNRRYNPIYERLDRG